jgi:hypothetical protein
MSGEIGIPVSTGLFLRLYDFLRDHGSDRDPVEVVSTAIEYWMDNADWKANDLMPETVAVRSLGYHWKPLLLPPATKVRMRYKGETHYASVVGDDFVYEDKSMSPSEFANQVAGGTNRNAWRDLWIKRPHDSEFHLADDLRRPKITFSELKRLLPSKTDEEAENFDG